MVLTPANVEDAEQIDWTHASRRPHCAEFPTSHVRMFDFISSLQTVNSHRNGGLACGCDPVRRPPVTQHGIKGKIVIIASGAKKHGGQIARDLAARSAQPIALHADLMTAGVTDHCPRFWPNCSRSVEIGKQVETVESKSLWPAHPRHKARSIPFIPAKSVLAPTTAVIGEQRNTHCGLTAMAIPNSIRRQRTKSAMSRQRDRWRSVVE